MKIDTKKLKERNGAIISAKEYQKYTDVSHAAVTKRLRKHRALEGIGNVSNIGNVYLLTVNVK